MAFSFVSALSRSLLGSNPGRARPEPVAPVSSIRLKNFLLAHGRKAGVREVAYYDYEGWSRPDPAEVKLFIEELSPGSCCFRTPTRLAVGEEIELQMLLQGLGSWRGVGKVEWLRESQPGYYGMVQLTRSQGPDLELFIQRQLEAARLGGL